MRWNPTEKFTDTCLSVRYILPMNKAWITPLNVLIMMYRNKTEHYVSSQKWITALSDAYDTKVGTTLYAYGNQMIIDYRYQYIRTDWIEDTTYEEKVIHLLDEFLFHPCFDIDSLDKAKYMLKNRLKRQMDDPDSLAVRSALTQIPAHHSLCVDLYGEYDQVDAISLGQINRLYREIKKAPCVVYSVGKISPRMKAYMETIDEADHIQANYDCIDVHDCIKQVVSKDISQTSVAQIYQTHIGMDSDLYYALLVANSMLGQCPNNLLFDTIREKYGYCYSISSSLIRFDGALLIQTGTEKQYVEKLLPLIDQQLGRLCRKEYEATLMENAKMDLIDGLISGQDYARTWIEQMYLDDLLHRKLTLEDKLNGIRSVTMDQVAEAAGSIQLISQAVIEENEDESL